MFPASRAQHHLGYSANTGLSYGLRRVHSKVISDLTNIMFTLSTFFPLPFLFCAPQGSVGIAPTIRQLSLPLTTETTFQEITFPPHAMFLTSLNIIR